MGSQGRIERLAKGLVILHPVVQHTASVIFIHGLGDTADGWLPQVQDWARAPSLGHVKWILPTAPTQPVTLNMGMAMPSWYDIKELGQSRAEDDAAGIEESRKIITDLINQEISSLKDPSRVVVGGFSQGGALSIFTGLQWPGPDRLGGVLCMSGYMPAAKKFQLSEAGKNTPFVMHHGQADPVVQPQWAQQTHAFLNQQGMNLTASESLYWYPGMPHSACPQETSRVREWLETLLPAAVPLKKYSEMTAKELKEAVARLNLLEESRGFAEKSEFVALLTEKAPQQ